MAVSTLLDHLNIAAPRLDAVRDRQLTGSFAGSVLPEPRRVLVRRLPSAAPFSRWLRVSPRARSQRVSFASPFLLDGAGGDACSLTDHERMRAALGRTVAAVRADLLNAGRSRLQGELRSP